MLINARTWRISGLPDSKLNNEPSRGWFDETVDWNSFWIGYSFHIDLGLKRRPTD